MVHAALLSNERKTSIPQKAGPAPPRVVPGAEPQPAEEENSAPGADRPICRGFAASSARKARPDRAVLHCTFTHMSLPVVPRHVATRPNLCQRMRAQKASLRCRCWSCSTCFTPVPGTLLHTCCPSGSACTRGQLKGEPLSAARRQPSWQALRGLSRCKVLTQYS